MNEHTPSREAARLHKDDAFHLLQNGRRRAALRYLFERAPGETRIQELADNVAAWEHDTSVQELASDDRQRVYISLYQTHLPTLAEHGVVDYDRDRGVVALRPLAGALEPFLGDRLRDPDADVVASPDRQPATSSNSSDGGGLLARFR